MSKEQQTARERVMTALRRQPPERTPFAWGFCATREMQETLAAYCRSQGLD